MAFIDTIPVHEADDATREMYARQQSHYGYVPGYARVFSHRPEVMARWAALLSSIKRPMDKRRFELVTFAAAHELKSTLCSLAHGNALTEFLAIDDVRAIAAGEEPASLSAAEAAMIRFARLVARNATAVRPDDVEELKRHGFADAEIFDIAAAAAGRAFFTKIIESLGADADLAFGNIDASLKQALMVGRAIEFVTPDRLPDAIPTPERAVV